MQMFKYLKSSWLLGAAGLLLAAPASHAATLSLGSGIPDLTTSSASVDYTFVEMCLGDDGGATSGLCGTDNGGKGPAKVTYNGALDPLASSGFLSVTGTSLFLDDGAGNFLTGGNYVLSANFDGFGNFVTTGSGVIADYATVISQADGSLVPGYNSGTMVTGDLILNGFTGAGDVGNIEFAFDITGGDFAGYGTNGGIMFTLFSGAGWDTGLDWDLTNSAGREFWQQSFNSTANVDTFVTTAVVPVPAALWLFGSGLLGLAGVARRRNH